MMKRALLLASALLSWAPTSHAELFASSSNFVQTLTVAEGEAIFISTMKPSAPFANPIDVSIARSNTAATFQIFTPYAGNSLILAGPIQIQFPRYNLFLEFQRLQATNIFTALFYASNTQATITVPAGKTVAFAVATSSHTSPSGLTSSGCIAATLSNQTAVVSTYLQGGDSFTGPLTITLQPGDPWQDNATLANAWATYYFTEELATIPEVGATKIPAGKASIKIEKSQDLTNWGTVFFSPVTQDTSAFYRLKASK